MPLLFIFNSSNFFILTNFVFMIKSILFVSLIYLAMRWWMLMNWNITKWNIWNIWIPICHGCHLYQWMGTFVIYIFVAIKYDNDIKRKRKRQTFPHSICDSRLKWLVLMLVVRLDSSLGPFCLVPVWPELFI